MQFITKEFHWCSAHRLCKDYPGKCRHLHGHNYKVEVTVEADTLDGYDFVMDFGELKPFKDWIDENLDHATLAFRHDRALLAFLEIHEQRRFVMDQNPTAENIAALLARAFNQNVKPANPQARLVKVEVWETPSSRATWTV